MQEALQAIAHPGRRRLLELVMDRELQAGELAERAGMSQPGASQHLKVLKDAGLLIVRRDGQRRLYRVDFAGLHALRTELNTFWGQRLERLRTATASRKRA